MVTGYDHYYPWLKESIKANLYPIELLPMFRRWFNQKWKKERLLEYLAERDKLALPPFHELLGLPYVEQLSLFGEPEPAFKARKLQPKKTTKQLTPRCK